MSEKEYKIQSLLFNQLVMRYFGCGEEQYLYKAELRRGIEQMEPDLRAFELKHHGEDIAEIERAAR